MPKFIKCLKAGRKPTVRRPARGSGGNIRRRRPRRARVFVQREQVLAVVSALSKLEGGTRGPLAYVQIGPKTLLEQTLERVFRCAANVLIVVPQAGLERARSLLGDTVSYCVGESFTLAPITPALESTNAPLVLVHDVCYPFAWPKLMMLALLGALDEGAAVTVTRPATPVAELEGESVLGSPVGTSAGLIHVPQAYLGPTLLEVARQTNGGSIPVDQAWRWVHEQGDTVRAVPNVAMNIKLGTALDLEVARKIIWPQIQSRLQSTTKTKGNTSANGGGSAR